MAAAVVVDDARSVAFREQWSPSSLNMFIKCPLSYWFEKAQGWRQVPGDARAAGTLVHAVLEGLLSLPGDERSVERARELYTSQWHALTADEANSVLDLDAVRQKAGTAIRNYFAMEDPARVDVVEDGLERSVSGTIGATAVGGSIDRIEAGPAGLRITDYKTGSAKAAYCGPYWRQQLVYASLLRAESDDPVVEVALAFLGPVSRLMVRPIPASALDRVGTDLTTATAQRASFAEAGRWEARESALCGYCPFRRSCPAQTSGAPVPGTGESDDRLATSRLLQRSTSNVVVVEDDDQGLEQWPA